MVGGFPLTRPARDLSAEVLSDIPARWDHVVGVARRAGEIGGNLPAVQRDLVTASAWLHDIGYAEGLASTGMHALDGALHLAHLGWPADVVGLVAFHTGAAVEADERGLAGMLVGFPRPPGHLLDILTAADLTSGPAGDRVTATERIDEILTRYEAADPVHRAVLRSRAALLAAVARTGGCSGSPDEDV